MINLPNILAAARIVIAPIIFFILLHASGDGDRFLGANASEWLAGFLFLIASITDFLDGYLARKWDQITKLGTVLDPLADKMLLLAAFLGLVIATKADAWAVYIILVREFFITGFRVVMATENLNIAAGFSGKVKTVLQMLAAGFLIMNWPLANALLWLAVAMTLISAAGYIYEYVRHNESK